MRVLKWIGAYLDGASSILDIYPEGGARISDPLPRKGDRKSLADDWRNIGNDFHRVIPKEKS